MHLAAEIIRIYVPTRARVTCNRLSLPEQLKSLSTTQASSQLGELPPAQKAAEAARLGNAVTRTLDLLPINSSCLTRSVVLAHLLSRRGIESSLVIAVNNDGGSFAAHAWVEHCGMPLSTLALTI